MGADSGVKTVEEAEAETEEVAVADPLASEMMEDEEDLRPQDAEVEAANVSAGLSESLTGVQPENTKEVCSCVRVIERPCVCPSVCLLSLPSLLCS